MTTDNSNNNRRTKVSTIIVLALLILSLLYLTIVMGEKNRLSNNLADKKLKAELLLSEKLELEKNNSKLAGDLLVINTREANLTSQLNNTNDKLNRTEQALKVVQIQASNTSQIKKQNQKLSVQNNELEQQVILHKKTINSLHSANNDLEKSAELLHHQNKNLTDSLKALELKIIDEALIEATKKNTKLTANSRKIKTLTTSINLSASVQTVKFRIKDPSGNELPTNDQNSKVKIVSTSSKASNAFYTNNASETSPVFKKVQLIYTPSTKLKTGTYTIVLTDDESIIGSLQVRLN